MSQLTEINLQKRQIALMSPFEEHGAIKELEEI